jgi:hypothetical protein
MIQTHAGLIQLIEQLNRMYSVMVELHSRIAGTNPAHYRLFAEGPIDEIRKLRREIDEYLGIDAEAVETNTEADHFN